MWKSKSKYYQRNKNSKHKYIEREEIKKNNHDELNPNVCINNKLKGNKTALHSSTLDVSLHIWIL